MRFVHFYGSLAEKYGSSHRINANSMRDIMWWGQANFKDFFDTIKSGSYQIIRGSLSDGDQLDGETISMQMGKGDIHVIPVAEGAGGEGSKGIFSVILGVALMATAFIVPGAQMGVAMADAIFTQGIGAALLGGMTYAQLALLGGVIALAGVSNLLSPMPEMNSNGNTKKSFVFGGPANNYEQGGPLPIVVGRFLCPACVVSTEVSTVDYNKGGGGDGPYRVSLWVTSGVGHGTITRTDTDPDQVISGATDHLVWDDGADDADYPAVAENTVMQFTVAASTGYVINYITVDNNTLSFRKESLTTKDFELTVRSGTHIFVGFKAEE